MDTDREKDINLGDDYPFGPLDAVGSSLLSEDVERFCAELRSAGSANFSGS